MARAMFGCKIIWRGNIISCMKSFGKRNCKLCMKERMAILEMIEKNPKKLINSRSELYGGCRHNTAFHRYDICSPVEHPSTDEGESQKESRRKRSNVRAIPNPNEKWWENVTAATTNVNLVSPPTGTRPTDSGGSNESAEPGEASEQASSYDV